VSSAIIIFIAFLELFKFLVLGLIVFLFLSKSDNLFNGYDGFENLLFFKTFFI
jgi:hypothetical protein